MASEFVKNAVSLQVSHAIDNLNRFKLVCKNRSVSGMKMQYGESGQTYQQVLDGYERYYNEALDEYNKL